MAHTVKYAPFIVLWALSFSFFLSLFSFYLFTLLPFYSFTLLPFLFYSPLVQSRCISLCVCHVLCIGHGKIVRSAEIRLGTHI